MSTFDFLNQGLFRGIKKSQTAITIPLHTAIQTGRPVRFGNSRGMQRRTRRVLTRIFLFLLMYRLHHIDIQYTTMARYVITRIFLIVTIVVIVRIAIFKMAAVRALTATQRAIGCVRIWLFGVAVPANTNADAQYD